jgi:hypothetical protein
MAVRYKVALVVCFCLLAGYRLAGQTTSPETTEEILFKGQVVLVNIQTAIKAHQAIDPAFQIQKQWPEDEQNAPKVLVLKDGKAYFDWSRGQQARYLMEALRQGLHALQAVDKPTSSDVEALKGAREYWPKLRDISCRENLGIRYYDLDGFEQYCPTK